jgi:copper homeostasis protein
VVRAGPLTTNRQRLTLEVIATSVGDAIAAAEGGADRIELLVDLPRGGMTPPLELVDDTITRVAIPVRVMLRETESHQIESPDVRARMLAIAHELAARPIDGVVFGFLRDGRVDVTFSQEVAAAIHPLHATFHRAFDAADMQEAALADLARVTGVDRVLTSGGDGSWDDRRQRLEAWARLALPRMLILVGGGVTEDTLSEVTGLQGIREVHVGRAAREGGDRRRPVEAARVASLVTRLAKLARP